MHGTVQGMIAVMRGGTFQNGFINGFLGKISGSLTKSLFAGASPDAMTFGGGAVATIMGGIAAEATGGDFAEGALTAMVVFLYNDLNKAIKEFNKGKMLSNSTGLGRAVQRFLGGKNREYSFGPLHSATKSLQSDPNLINAIRLYRNRFYLKYNRWPGKGDFGFLTTGTFFPFGKGKANLNLQIIGSYSASIYFTSKKDYIVYVTNKMSWKSFLYHTIPDSWSNRLNSVTTRFMYNGEI